MCYFLLVVLVLGSACPHASTYMTLPEMVETLALERGVDVDRALLAVTLESEWDPNAVGDEGQAVGLWQFHPGTWEWACDLTGRPDWRDPVNRLDPVRSTIVALDMIARGWGHLWTGWRMAGG